MYIYAYNAYVCSSIFSHLLSFRFVSFYYYTTLMPSAGINGTFSRWHNIFQIGCQQWTCCGGVPLSPSTLTVSNLLKCTASGQFTRVIHVRYFPILTYFSHLFLYFFFLCLFLFFCTVFSWPRVGILLCHLGIACESQINYNISGKCVCKFALNIFAIIMLCIFFIFPLFVVLSLY